MTAFAAHFDDNQVSTQMGVVGTLGTADEAGTAKSIPIGVDPATGAQYVNILSGSINVGTIAEELSIASGTLTVLPQVSVGTLPTLTTVSNLTNGSVNLLSGTINSATVTTTSLTGFEGGTVSVGTAAVELTFSGVTKSVLITADHNNGTMIYIGASTITQAGADAITRLDPGESLSLDLNDASAALYAVAGTTGQKVYKVALT